MDPSIMCPHLNPSLIIARHPHPHGSSEIDKVAQHSLVHARHQDLDVQGCTLGFGLDCERPKEIRSIHVEVHSVVLAHHNHFGRGKLIVRVEQMDGGADAT